MAKPINKQVAKQAGKQHPTQRTEGEITASIVGYSGPIPPPEQLSAFNGIIHNGAERIMVMAEKAQNAQIERSNKLLAIQKASVTGEHVTTISGQILSFLLHIALVAGGFALIWHGFDWQGVFFSGVPMFNIAVNIFMRGRNRK